jgi:competence ComEA-like helix-hairpin-helix protein
MIKKISQKFGFTETEVLVILFLAAAFVLGFIYKEFFKDETTSEYKNFDYSQEDSLFLYYSNLNPEIDPDDSLLVSNLEIKKKVLELKDSLFYSKKETITLVEKSININSAGIEELVLLPGIGQKTAEKILLLRKERGKFRKLDEIMDVKGIGEIKFNKIKKFLYIK